MAVVIGRNEGERLRRCLLSLAAQQLAIVYVDSGSSDGSVELAAVHGAEVVALDPATPFGAARARNEGAWKAALVQPGCKFIQFVDGDCEVDRDWIATAARFLDARPDVAIACGRRRERFPDASFYNKVCDQEWDTPIGEARACGGDFLVRRSVFDTAGGFDTSLMAGEEPEMCARIRGLGWKVWRLDSPMTTHDAAMMSFGQWWKRATRSGIGYAQAWHASSDRDERLYASELRRALFWAGLVPIGGIFLAAFAHPLWLFLAPAAWLLQIARLSRSLGWRKAALFTVGKGAELAGLMIWLFRSARGVQRHAVTYK
ncbi:glycosyltransferase [Sphingomonas sp. M1-B02]|uniref:glycosyltransferase n=1 Tax=Sphingomonas sp. M1-B02 TaxID=3114300 RepID=UPI002240511A|nr:glycosyltransferase [Sphingomonas sp. S6-11]UZK67738.1 glycosyltransferase [Sphingomonas sp. S6-11]